MTKTEQPVDYAALGWTYSCWARNFSMLLALLLSALLLALPQLVANTAVEVSHAALMFSLWGISAGFVHGVGYVPVMRLWQWLFGPWLAWPGMLFCCLWFARDLLG